MRMAIVIDIVRIATVMATVMDIVRIATVVGIMRMSQQSWI